MALFDDSITMFDLFYDDFLTEFEEHQEQNHVFIIYFPVQ